MCAGLGKDQTPKEYAGVGEVGTLLVLDEIAEAHQEPQVRLIPHVTYGQAQARACNAVAFKWLPASVMSKTEIADADCSMRCPGVTTCPSPCLCYAEQCYNGS
jgi:hypothetical protein